MASTLTASNDALSLINQAIPGFIGMQSQASENIGSLLKGVPSPSVAGNAEATFGAQSGAGADSGFANRWGYDLYNQMGQDRQETGLKDLLALLGGTAGVLTPNMSQGIATQQGNEDMGQRQFEYNTTFAENQRRYNQDRADKLNAMKKIGTGKTFGINMLSVPNDWTGSIWEDPQGIARFGSGPSEGGWGL